MTRTSRNFRFGSFTSFLPSRRVRFAPRADIRAGRIALRENRARQHHPAGPGGSEAARPKINLSKSSRRLRAKRRSVAACCPACAAPSPGGALLGTARSWRGIVSFTHLAREGRMTVTIGRRELLAALGGAAAWPLAARAQQSTNKVSVGFLSVNAPSAMIARIDAFQRGLGDLGHIVEQNIAVEYRFAEGQPDRLRALADELVHLKVTVTVTQPTPSPLSA